MNPKHLSDEILTRYLESLRARMEAGMPFEIREIELAARIAGAAAEDPAGDRPRPRLSDLSPDDVKELRECLRQAHFRLS